MTGRNISSLALTMAVLAATSAAVPRASAQEAIMLERIGAVRMAAPSEALRAATGQGRSVALDPQNQHAVSQGRRAADGNDGAN